MNHDALANPKVHPVIGDARELLLVTRDKYDLIFSEPSNPYRPSVIVRYLAIEYGSLSQPAACSLGTTNCLHVSASVRIRI